MSKAKGDYLVLAVLSLIYLVAIFRYQSNSLYLLLATIFFAIGYLLWGIFHQLHNHNFHARVMLEYFLVALLGVAIISTLLI